MNPTGVPFGAPVAPPRNEQLNLAAILLMVGAALTIAYALFVLVTSGAREDPSWMLAMVKDAELRERLRDALSNSGSGAARGAQLLFPMMMMAANGFILFGATKLRNAQAYNVSLLAAGLSTIPCCFSGCCCVVTMPAGNFAVVVLLKPEVKALFTS